MRGLAFFAFGALLAGQPSAEGEVQGPQGNFVRLVVPESDTTITSSPTYRLSASTRPGNSVTLNGSPLRVYPSGAFVSLLDLQPGDNLFTIVARNDSGSMLSRSFLLTRTPLISSTRSDTLAIEEFMMEPLRDLWLRDHELLKVQCKGTPGCRATFLGGLPMREVPPEESNGLRGVYRGVYLVRENDSLRNTPVMFRLEDSLGHAATKESRGRVTAIEERLPLVAVTRGNRPYLNFGLGEDRLGGAKLSFLTPGVRLAITGKAGREYRVELTPDQEAWIPGDLVEMQVAGTYPPYSLTGSWSVYGDEKFDYVTIGLSERIPYASFQESGPTRINVDLYGAVCNTNWITQHLTTKEIKAVSYKQVGKNLFRITIELHHKQLWGYELSYRGTTFVIKVRRQPERLRIRSLSFALDAGHGGTNEGAVGATGAREKDVNLAIVLQLRDLLLKKGAHIVLTRDADSTIANGDRLRNVLDSGADILVSVHSNSIGFTTNPEATKGVSTYYKHPAYRRLSQCILSEVLKTGLASFGNVGAFNFMLNSPTELPNALVELAFISNPEDEMKLLDDEFRQKIAKRIVDGIEDFLDECED